MTNTIRDITQESDVIMLVGSNPEEAHPVLGMQIRQAVRRGARLIVVDPRDIDLAKHADIHLKLRPGTNVAFANGMMNIILEEQLQDRTDDRADDGVLIAQPDVPVADDLGVVIQGRVLRVEQQAAFGGDVAGAQAQVEQVPEADDDGTAEQDQDQVNQGFADGEFILHHIRPPPYQIPSPLMRRATRLVPSTRTKAITFLNRPTAVAKEYFISPRP